MKYYNDKMNNKESHVNTGDYKRPYQMNRNFVADQYKTQEIVKKTGETSELIIEDNTVYEIDKECIACLKNKKL